MMGWLRRQSEFVQMLIVIPALLFGAFFVGRVILNNGSDCENHNAFVAEGRALADRAFDTDMSQEATVRWGKNFVERETTEPDCESAFWKGYDLGSDPAGLRPFH